MPRPSETAAEKRSFLIYDNMSYIGKPDTKKYGLIASNIIDEGRIWPPGHNYGVLPNRGSFDAIVAANCSDFIANLPEGVGTIVGDRGMKLSPGQRQRIGIARAFLKDAPILLLDEATSALDSESEEAVRQALDRLMRSRTVIAIAHRLSTLRSFDRIIVLQAGRICEDGPPQVLIGRRGVYSKLVQREVARLGKQAA